MPKWDRVHNADNYSVETATSPDGPFTHKAVVSQARAVLDGFEPGKVYWIRVCANGSAGPSGYAGPANAMAV